MKAAITLMIFTIICVSMEQYECIGEFTPISVGDGNMMDPIYDKAKSGFDQVRNDLRQSLFGCPDQNNGRQARCWWGGEGKSVND